MTTLFHDMASIKHEYKRLFFNTLNDLELIKQCIQARHNLRSIDNHQVQHLFTNNHQYICAMFGSTNINRIRHFFGNYKTNDYRDSQIRLVDRLILDSLHFDIMATLIKQLICDYTDNKKAIENAWFARLNMEDQAEWDEIPKITIVQQIIQKEIKEVFSDLLFPHRRQAHLFLFDHHRLIFNDQVFQNWINPPAINLKNHFWSDSIPLNVVTNEEKTSKKFLKL